MPRRNAQSSLAEEQNLAQRIEYERTARDWSYEGLARRMTEVGCPLNASALYKVEKGQPRRRITVTEMVPFSRVFGLRLDELLVPADIAKSRAATRAVERWTEARAAVAKADADLDKAWAAVTAVLNKEPGVADSVRKYLAEWASRTWGDEIADEAADYFISRAVGDIEGHRERWTHGETIRHG